MADEPINTPAGRRRCTPDMPEYRKIEVGIRRRSARTLERSGARSRTPEHVHRRHRPARVCTTWCTKSSTTRSTKPWPATRTRSSVTINIDGSVTVEDDGRGIPVENHPDLGFSTLQGVMTVLKFGGKFSKGAYQTSGGLHGVGVTVVNFLSEWCEVEVRRKGHVYQQEYERGEPTTEVRRIGTTDKVGTKTTFKPDPRNLRQSEVRLQHALQALARVGVPQSRRAASRSAISAPAKATRSSTSAASSSSSRT